MKELLEDVARTIHSAANPELCHTLLKGSRLGQHQQVANPELCHTLLKESRLGQHQQVANP
jgi:hypothetical protein